MVAHLHIHVAAAQIAGARRALRADALHIERDVSLARLFDFFTFGEDRRLGPHKQRLFSKALGKTLLVAAGTGNDFKFFPPGMQLIATDISEQMIERARRKAALYSGRIDLAVKDVCDLDVPDSTFDTIVTVFTFCSVPRPIVGLRELHRVLKSSGQLLMMEHVRSAFGPLGVMMGLLTPLSRRFGSDLNRNTDGNVQEAGFRLRRVENAYLDVVKIIEAVKSDGAAH